MGVAIATTDRVMTLSRPVGNAAQQWTQRRSLVVRMSSEDGAFGVGEAAPLPGRSPESYESVRGAVAKLPGHLALDSAMTPSDVWDTVAAIHERGAHPSLHFALESAALDWVASRRGETVHAQIAAASVGVPGALRSVPLAAMVDAQPSAWLTEARDWTARGYRTLKFKVGGVWRDECAALQRVRDAFPSLVIRLDANGTWSLQQWREAEPRLSELGVEFVEDPLPWRELHRVATSEVPIAIDDRVADHGWLRDALRWDAVRYVVVKPTLVGGVAATLVLADFASKHGAALVVSHALEGEVGLRSCAELALGLQQTTAAGLAPHRALNESALDRWPIFDGPRLRPARSTTSAGRDEGDSNVG